jgi:hypothetical protein
MHILTLVLAAVAVNAQSLPVPAPSAATAPAHAQVSGERVRGLVVSDSGAPIPGADVVVTRTTDRQFMATRTGADGRFVIDFPDRSGDYAVRVSALGFRPVTKHVVVPAGAAEVVVDVQLARGSAQQLSAVITRAQVTPPRPDRAAANSPVGVGAAETVSSPQGAAQRIGPDVAGDLAAIAAMSSNVAPVPGGISVFGLGAAQNSVTLNGLAFGGSVIPRSVRASVRVSASSYDPANGWFSGARTNVQLATGGLFSSRDAHLSGDTPVLQASDPGVRQFGQRFNNVNLSLGGDGQLIQDRYAYNYGVQAIRRTTDAASLQFADPSVLATLGLSPDSAARLGSLLRGLGIPGGAAHTFTTQNVTFLGRVDHAPYDWATLTSATTTAGITAYARAARTDAAGISPLSFAAHAGSTNQLAGALQADYSHYAARNWLNTTRTGVAFSNGSSTPYVQLPDGRVQVQSQLTDGAPTTSLAQFGGQSSLGGTARTFTWESVEELQLYTSAATTHRITFTADARFDASAQDQAQNAFGTFTYNTLADLGANRPSSFTRTLANPTRQGSEWNAYASVSDLWRVSPSLQVLYGARIEGSTFAQQPVNNPAVASAFGVRNDAAPSALHASPRAGFTWTLPAKGGLGSSVIRGGAGEFRNLLDPALLAAASAATGLPGGVTQVSCIGSAVPATAWSGWVADPSTIPTQCANGAASFADPAQQVRLVAPDYSPTRSWRGNVGWGSSLKGNVFSVDAAYSKNLSQPGTIDLNFAGQRLFTTSDEGRAVFVPSTSIVSATGTVSSVNARWNGAFGRVVESVSALESESRQLSFLLRPKLPPPPGKLGDVAIGYTLSSVRADQRGFDAPTFGDPRQLENARGDLDARHRFTFQGIVRPAPGFFLFLFGRLQSGTPYTPMVGGDVNGDAIANDRAFIFDPSRATDPAIKTGIQALLASPDSRVRDCVASQLGRAAGRNSCEGTWTAAFNANLRIDSDRLHIPRTQLFIDFQNPLAGIDQLIHGLNNARGWGSSVAPDPVLYHVRGFDAGNNRFVYDVNPRFGQTLPNGIGNVRSPFRVTFDVSVDIGRALPEQQLDRWLGASSRSAGGKLDEETLARRLSRNVPDPYAQLLVQADSLLLSDAQVSELRQAEQRLRQRSDSAWRELATYLAALPEAYDVNAASGRVDKTIGAVWEIARQNIRATLGKALEPVQLATLSGWAGQLWRAAGPMRVRIYGG